MWLKSNSDSCWVASELGGSAPATRGFVLTLSFYVSFCLKALCNVRGKMLRWLYHALGQSKPRYTLSAAEQVFYCVEVGDLRCIRVDVLKANQPRLFTRFLWIKTMETRFLAPCCTWWHCSDTERM